MQPPVRESLESQQRAAAATERRAASTQSGHRVTIAIGSLGALLMGAMCWGLRGVAANPETGVPAHNDSTLTYGAYFLWFLAAIMALGVAGFLNIGTPESLKERGQRGVFGPPGTRTVHHHHHHHGAPPSSAPDEGEPKVTRWTD